MFMESPAASLTSCPERLAEEIRLEVGREKLSTGMHEVRGSFTSRRLMPDRVAHSFASLQPMLVSVATQS
jgi:hypothetical protein